MFLDKEEARPTPFWYLQLDNSSKEHTHCRRVEVAEKIGCQQESKQCGGRSAIQIASGRKNVTGLCKKVLRAQLMPPLQLKQGLLFLLC
jgi:hypothetical protein